MSRAAKRDMSERIAAMNRRSQGAGYRLPKQRPDTRVSLALNPLGPDYGPVILGYVVDHIGDRVEILWDEADESEVWRSEDCKYKVDRGLMIFTPPPKQRRIRIPRDKLVCKQCGDLRKDCDCPRISALKPEEWGRDRNHPDRPVGSHDPALTGEDLEDSIAPSSKGAALRTEERKPMPKTEDTVSAKELARQLGTDARTLRKFLRSDASPVEPPGQGGRYEFTAKQVKKVTKAFEAWGTRKSTRTRKPPMKDVTEIEEVTDNEEIEDLEDSDLGDLDGPSDEDLIDLDDDIDILEEGF